MSAQILTDKDQTLFHPNDKVRGIVQWSVPRSPESARLQLFYFTEGKGTRDVVVQATEVFTAPLARDKREFEFHLPPTPWSFCGKLVSVHWAVELLLDRPPRDDLTRLELVVSPTREVIDLYDHSDAPKEQTMWQEFWQRFTG